MGVSETLVIDYGMGNIWSVVSALRFLGATPEVCSDPGRVMRARRLVLPGVGSFRRAMESLQSSGMDEAIRHAVLKEGSALLGICLGMQLLGSVGTEDGETKGLGLIDKRVDPFTSAELSGRKIPHIGFNQVVPAPGSRLFQGFPEEPDFYFVHSYRMPADIPGARVSRCNHGVDFAAAVERENVFGVQFHPEKSQTNGLALLKNFLAV